MAGVEPPAGLDGRDVSAVFEGRTVARETPLDPALRLAAALKAMNRRVLLIHREDTGHSTNYEDARAIIEFAVDQAGVGAVQ